MVSKPTEAGLQEAQETEEADVADGEGSQIQNLLSMRGARVGWV